VELAGVEMRAKRETFFKLVFGKSSGYVCIAFLKDKKFTEEYFQYPDNLNVMLDRIENFIVGYNVYFCPQLLRERKRSKEYVETTPNIWADLDTCDPKLLMVEPTIVVESSPRRYQGYWVMDRIPDSDDAEDLARRIAYAHAADGADRSGWDLTQLLRVPFTFNYKYTIGAVPIVQIISANRNQYRLSDFSDYPESPEYVTTEIPMPDLSDLPPSADELLQARRLQLNPLIWRLYSEEPALGLWSQELWNLEMLLFESGFKREEVYVIARESKCNKYARDGKPAALLWKDVCRAEQKAEVHQKLLVGDVEEKLQLLSEEEKNLIDRLDDTFIERYIKWASSLGDAAAQYHQAGAFVILSSLLSGTVRLPTSYGTIVPNIWFMILADTTLTRKTTSMDIAMDLVMEVDDEVIMATDGSIEGLLSALSSRPGRPSVFLRDEFSGLLEAMTKKDYMAGMPELLTKLYDGKMQKRILRKEVIEVRDPRLIFFAGGIKNKITSILSFEHVSSGFMPRFVFITAESDISRLRPIGPPSQKTTGNKDAILNELKDLHKHYNRTTMLHVQKLKTSIEHNVTYDATLTDDAWVRYNQLETALLEEGLKSRRPEIMTPMGDRLAKSILKAAVLLAASRQKNDTVEVTKEDILRCIKYGESWYGFALDVMNNVGKGTAERQLDNIIRAIAKNGDRGVPRSQLMQSYHLTSRDANSIFDTLEQRGLITRQRSGRTELLVPTKKGKYSG